MCEILEDKGCPVHSCVLTFIWLTPSRHQLYWRQMRRCAWSHAVLLIPVPCSPLVRMPSIFSSAWGKRHPEKQKLPSLPPQEVPSWTGQLWYPEPWFTEAFLSGHLPQWYHFTFQKSTVPLSILTPLWGPSELILSGSMSCCDAVYSPSLQRKNGCGHWNSSMCLTTCVT